MKILLAHNYYRYPGGEDEVFQSEQELLRSAGHEILEFARHNSEIMEDGIFSKAKLGVRTLWARDSQQELRAILQRERPQVVHFHNTFPLISPAAYYACQEAGVPVVQSLHNARLMCPAATFYREGGVCEACLGRAVPWPGVLHACYHQSHVQTAIVAGMLCTHRILRTWHEQVDAYIVFTNFFRQKFIASGLPGEKIFVKPHSLNSDPGMKQGPGSYALFIGRLAPGKGVPTLLKAWENLKHIPLRIAGEGPLKKDVHEFKKDNPSVSIRPYLPRKECLELIKGARFLVWPSEGSETFGLVAIEAFACSTPVIASGLGATAEVVEEQKTGLHFEAGNAEDLAAKVEWAWEHPQEMEAMGRAGRNEYESKYTAPTNYEALMSVYRSAIRIHARQKKSFLPASTQMQGNRA